MGIPTAGIVLTKMGKGVPRNEQGTWVHPQVAVNLGQWCSPKLAVAFSTPDCSERAPLIYDHEQGEESTRSVMSGLPVRLGKYQSGER